MSALDDEDSQSEPNKRKRTLPLLSEVEVEEPISKRMKMSEDMDPKRKTLYLLDSDDAMPKRKRSYLPVNEDFILVEQEKTVALPDSEKVFPLPKKTRISSPDVDLPLFDEEKVTSLPVSEDTLPSLKRKRASSQDNEDMLVQNKETNSLADTRADILQLKRKKMFSPVGVDSAQLVPKRKKIFSSYYGDGDDLLKLEKNKFSLNKERALLVLKNNEVKLLAAIRNCSLRDFCTRLHNENVISTEVMDRFLSLDHDNFGQELMVRYLLHWVYEKVEEQDLLYAFLDIISTIDQELAGEIRSALRGSSIEHYLICESDVPNLTGLLTKISYKAKELGLALGVPNSQVMLGLEECSNTVALSNILLEWIKTSKFPCTIDRLKTALSSDNVGHSDIANQVVKKFQPSKQQHVSSDNNIKCIFQSGDTSGAYGKPALLGFLTSIDKPGSYQWRKNGEPLSDDFNYYDTQRAFLYIHHVCEQTEGLYDCKVHTDHGELSSEKMKLILNYSETTNKFLQIYGKNRELPEDSWPPVQSNAFINLALIVKNDDDDINEIFEYSEQVEGDDFKVSREDVTYLEAFQMFESGSLVLVEGHPGSGKTTLMHKLTKDWMRNSVLLGADIVVLVPVRLFRDTGEAITLFNIFKYYFKDYSQTKEFVLRANENNGKGICFIIDGLEGYEYIKDENAELHQLLHRQLLPFSMVIVASDPLATASIRNYGVITKRIEILGFTKVQLFAYIKSYFWHDEENLAFQLISYLNLHVNVLHMCYIPVHAAMICFLYSMLRGNIPQTETRIYESFTMQTILRTLLRKQSMSDLRLISLQSLQGDVKEWFMGVCRLAFHMVMQSKRLVLESNLDFPLFDFDNSLGLVSIDKISGLFGMENLYSFTHIIYQEFLAAYYLASLNEEEVISKTIGRQANLQQVWKFYCGIVTFTKNSPVLTYIMSNTDLDSLYKILCAFESQQKSVCEKAFELEKANLFSIKYHSLTPADFLAISYVISNIQDFAVGMAFTECTFDKEGIMLLTEKLNWHHFRNVKNLVYHKMICSVVQFEALNMLLANLTGLEILDLQGTELGIVGVRKLTESVKLPNLTTLKFQVPLNNHYEDPKTLKLLRFNSVKLGQIHYLCPKSKSYLESCEYVNILMKAFGQILCYSTRYQLISCINHVFLAIPLNNKAYLRGCSKLLLINCGITDDKVNLLVEAITICESLDTLHLDFNEITSKGAILISPFLKKQAKFEIFSAHWNQIDDSGALAIVQALIPLSNIKFVDLQCNPITNDGASALMKAVQYLPDFKLFISSINENFELMQRSVNLVKKFDNDRNVVFKVSKYFRQSQGVKSYYKNLINFKWNDKMSESNEVTLLIENLKYCDKLQTLKLDYGSITSESAVTLAEGLKTCMNLQTLSLDHNSITSVGAVALSEGIKHCSGLQIISLNSNSIGSDGAVALAEGIKYCSCLQVISLNSNSIGSDGAAALVFGLQSCTNLQSLSLGRCDICSLGAVVVAEILEYVTTLQTLRLNCNGIGSDGAVAVATRLKYCSNLESLNLSRNNIGSDGAVALAEGLKHCTTIQRLYLSCSSIGLNGAVALADCLTCCTNLQVFDLDNNNIDSDGAAAIAEGLEGCINLQSLYLFKNSIGSARMEAFTQGLQCCIFLQNLNLSRNSIGPDGAMNLAKGLKCCIELQRLNLSRNRIGSEGAMALAEGLKFCTNLQTLNLIGNSIGSSGAVALAGALKECINLQLLHLRKNDIGLEGAEALSELIECCNNLKLFPRKLRIN